MQSSISKYTVLLRLDTSALSEGSTGTGDSTHLTRTIEWVVKYFQEKYPDAALEIAVVHAHNKNFSPSYKPVFDQLHSKYKALTGELFEIECDKRMTVDTYDQYIDKHAALQSVYSKAALLVNVSTDFLISNRDTLLPMLSLTEINASSYSQDMRAAERHYMQTLTPSHKPWGGSEVRYSQSYGSLHQVCVMGLDKEQSGLPIADESVAVGGKQALWQNICQDLNENDAMRESFNPERLEEEAYLRDIAIIPIYVNRGQLSQALGCIKSKLEDGDPLLTNKKLMLVIGKRCWNKEAI